MDLMQHPDADSLELYLLGRMAKETPELIAIEEHLLICPECISAAEAHDDAVAMIRAGLRHLEQHPPELKGRATKRNVNSEEKPKTMKARP